MKTPTFANSSKKHTDATHAHVWIAHHWHHHVPTHVLQQPPAHAGVTSAHHPRTATAAPAAANPATWTTWTPGAPTSVANVATFPGRLMPRHYVTRKLELEEACRITSRCNGSSATRPPVQALKGSGEFPIGYDNTYKNFLQILYKVKKS